MMKTQYLVVWDVDATWGTPINEELAHTFDTKDAAQSFKAEHPLGKFAAVIKRTVHE